MEAGTIILALVRVVQLPFIARFRVRRTPTPRGTARPARRLPNSPVTASPPMSKRRKQYRPGIDDPPPTFFVWLAGALGLAGVAALAGSLLKRLKRS